MKKNLKFMLAGLVIGARVSTDYSRQLGYERSEKYTGCF